MTWLPQIDPILALQTATTFLLAGTLVGTIVNIRDARRSSERQLRAYLLFEDTRQEEVHGAGGRESWRFSFLSMNRGQTPATNARMVCAIGVAASSAAATELEIEPPNENDVGGAVGPNQPLTGGEVFLTEQQAAGVHAGKLKALARAVVTYEDIFGRKHCTDLTVELCVLPTGPAGHYRWGNRIVRSSAT